MFKRYWCLKGCGKRVVNDHCVAYGSSPKKRRTVYKCSECNTEFTREQIATINTIKKQGRYVPKSLKEKIEND